MALIRATFIRSRKKGIFEIVSRFPFVWVPTLTFLIPERVIFFFFFLATCWKILYKNFLYCNEKYFIWIFCFWSLLFDLKICCRKFLLIFSFSKKLLTNKNFLYIVVSIKAWFILFDPQQYSQESVKKRSKRGLKV